MTTRQRRYPKAEFARRGDAIYERDIRPHLKPKDNGKLVAIDIDSADYEIGKDELAVGDRLLARRPDAQIWVVRVGSRYVHSFGGHRTSGRGSRGK